MNHSRSRSGAGGIGARDALERRVGGDGAAGQIVEALLEAALVRAAAVAST